VLTPELAHYRWIRIERNRCEVSAGLLDRDQKGARARGGIDDSTMDVSRQRIRKYVGGPTGGEMLIDQAAALRN